MVVFDKSEFHQDPFIYFIELGPSHACGSLPKRVFDYWKLFIYALFFTEHKSNNEPPILGVQCPFSKSFTLKGFFIG